MRTSLGSNLSLEAEAGLISPIHTPSTSPLPAVPTSPLPTPTSLLDHPGVQGTCQAASYLVHYYSSFKSVFGALGIPPGWVISLLRACTTLMSLCTSLGPLSFALVRQGLCPAWPFSAQAPWTVAN